MKPLTTLQFNNADIPYMKPVLNILTLFQGKEDNIFRTTKKYSMPKGEI
jgi:hypothetical protein